MSTVPHVYGSNGNVRCTTILKNNIWSSTLTKSINCRSNGIGVHTCGNYAGWMLWWGDKQFNQNRNHPCPI